MLIGTRKGDKVSYGGVPMRVIGARDMDTLVVASVEGEIFNAPINELEAEASNLKTKEGVDVDPIRASKVDSYLTAFKPLLDNDRNTKASIKQAADSLGISVSSAYKALARYRESGRTDLLPPPTSPGGRGKPRINRKAQEIIEEVIERVVLTRQGASPRKFYREVKRRLEKAGLEVSQSTLADRLSRIPEYRFTKARKGYNETRKTHDPIRDHYPEVTRPLEVVQIDHWKADIEVLSEDRTEVIGRVWITLAIDVFSRMVFGMHVGFDAPSTMTFGMAMINGMTSKDAVAREHGLEWDNPIRGKPIRLELDNAGEFTGKSARASAKHFGIRLKWRPIGQPQYGAHIERLNGTLASRFKDLPGATGATPEERKQLRPEMTAAFTLQDVTKHAWLMVDEYHNEVHTGIGKTPLEKFKGHYFGPHGQRHRLPPVYVDNLQFRLHWFPLVTRTIQRYGIRIDHLDYYSPALAWLVRNRKNYGPVEVRRHPFDVRVIYVRHPDRTTENPDGTGDDEWIAVHVRQMNFPLASIYQLQQARREALRRSREPTPDVLCKIILEQRKHIEEATKKTKTAQREAARKSHHDRMRDSTDPALPMANKNPASPNAIPIPQNDVTVEPAAQPLAPKPDEGSLAAILANISDEELDEVFE